MQKNKQLKPDLPISDTQYSLILNNISLNFQNCLFYIYLKSNRFNEHRLNK